MEQRTLIAAYKFYCSKELKNAHNAMADTMATWEVLESQLEKYKDLEPNAQFLSEFSRNSAHQTLDFAGRLAINNKGEAIYNFGKHKGKTIKNVSVLEPGYYGWMLEANFPRYTKKVLMREMEKIKADNKMESKEDYQSKLSQLQNKFKK